MMEVFFSMARLNQSLLAIEIGLIKIIEIVSVEVA